MAIFYWALLTPAIAAIMPKKQPLVSLLTLEAMSKRDICKNYPTGIKVTEQRMPRRLLQKLRELEQSGYPIKWYKPDIERLQAYTTHVIHKADLAAYLNEVYGEEPGCSSFIYKELLKRALKDHLPTETSCLKDISEKTASFYRSVLANHRYWSNIGFTGLNNAPEDVQTWLKQSAKATEQINNRALKKCLINLSPEQLTEISQLTALHFLNDAVKGLNHISERALLPHYRKLAVKAVLANKVITPPRKKH